MGGQCETAKRSSRNCFAKITIIQIRQASYPTSDKSTSEASGHEIKLEKLPKDLGRQSLVLNMKVDQLSLSGFRGARVAVNIALRGRSHFVYAENGFGKTTVVDALEFWSTGDVETYHREGAGLDSVINLDSDTAVVSCTPLGGLEISRSLIRRGSSGYIQGPPDPALNFISSIPILRHRAMADFMAKSAGEKKDALLQILGLEELISFRDTLRTASNDAKRAAEISSQTHRSEVSALQSLCGDKGVLELAEELRVRAGLSVPVDSESALETLQVSDVVIAGTPNYSNIIAEFDRTRDLSDVLNAINAWNVSVEDVAKSTAAILSDLLTSAEPVIEIWPEESCPLCEQPVELVDLRERVSTRIEGLKDAVRERSNLRLLMTDAAAEVQQFLRSLKELSSNPPTGGWRDGQLIENSIVVTQHLSESIDSAISNNAKCALPEYGVLPTSVTLREDVANSSTETDAVQALIALIGLRDQHRRVIGARGMTERAAIVATALKSLLDDTSTRIEGELEEALTELSDQVSIYYGMLRSSHLYGDIHLQYTTSRSGGIEFHFEFDGRHEVSPPHRVMSESQLNSLGLALFLARLKIAETNWRFFVLDDVVNSFDADHRIGLAKLLQTEFADWQVLLLTHDRYFRSISQDVLSEWSFVSIGAWTPSGGPVITMGDSLDLLIARIREGVTASELGGVARVALEEELSRPLSKLEIPIRYDPLARFSAKDLVNALRSGLNKAKSESLRDLPVLRRLAAATYVSNLGAHYRPSDPQPSLDDLEQLARDLTELRSTFVCPTCETKVWKLKDMTQNRWQCKCSSLQF